MKTIEQIEHNAAFRLLRMGRARWFVALMGLLLLAGCSGDDFAADNGDDTDAQRLSVSVSDGGYLSAEKGLQTRAIDNGYTTAFTTGDKIGVFAIKDGAIRPEVNNICLTASVETSNLVWKDASGNAPLKFSGATYYAYYPYQATLTGALDPSASNAFDFFGNVINNWTPTTDQGTYAKYTAQDLMVAEGSISNSVLSFAMEHQMGLVVIELPGTIYEFSNTNPSVPDYITDPINTHFDNHSPCKMTDGMYRYLVKPSQPMTLTGGYTNASGAAKGWDISSNHDGGKYKRYAIDGALVTTTSHNLQGGDYMLKGGMLVSKDATLTQMQKDNCMGIVFWVGDPTKGEHDNGTAFTDFGDPALKNEKPHCNHGLIVALQDASTAGMKWQATPTDVGSWTANTSYGSITTHQNENDPLNKLRGYTNTQAIRLYNASVGNSSPNLVLPVQAIDTWVASNAAPVNSSGWYFPSEKELSLLCGRDVNSIYWNDSGGVEMRDIVNASLNKVGSSATAIASSFYWSSSEDINTTHAYVLLFSSNFINNSQKDNSNYRVRSVLAF